MLQRILLGHGTGGAPPDVSARFFAHAEEFALAALRVGPDTPALGASTPP